MTADMENPEPLSYRTSLNSHCETCQEDGVADVFSRFPDWKADEDALKVCQKCHTITDLKL